MHTRISRQYNIPVINTAFVSGKLYFSPQDHYAHRPTRPVCHVQTGPVDGVTAPFGPVEGVVDGHTVAGAPVFTPGTKAVLRAPWGGGRQTTMNIL